MSVCRNGYYQLQQLRPLVWCLSEDAVKTLIQVFINTRLDYCNSLYFVIADGLMSRLQSVQNAEARTSRQSYISCTGWQSTDEWNSRYPPSSTFVGWHCSCVPSWRMYAGHRSGRCPLRSADSRTCVVRLSATSLVTALLPPPVQRCGTVCLNSFRNRKSPLDNLNDRLKRLCLVSQVAAPCVWTLRAPTPYLLTYLQDCLVLSCRQCELSWRQSQTVFNILETEVLSSIVFGVIVNAFEN